MSHRASSPSSLAISILLGRRMGAHVVVRVLADNHRIWISPVTKQIDNNTAYGEAYHGYWQQDIYTLNPHFGTASDLADLSAALHARGMALMVDVVVNHFGSPYVVDYSIYTPFNDGSYFHQEAFITDYNNQTMVEQGWLGDGNVPLPDVDTENEVVVNTFYSWISDLVQTYQIDGLRIDTVKHVRKDFWPGFVNAASVFALGEVLSGDPTYLSSYQPYVGGLLDYGTYYPLLRAFQSGGNMGELAALIAPSYRAAFTDTQLLGTFMENHDNPRFPYAVSSDSAIVRSAMAYTMFADGIPIIYYGQEQGFAGGDEPACREYLWMSGYSITPLYTYLATLNQARNLAWSAGFGTNLSTALYLDTNSMVTQKGPLMLALSNQGSTSSNKTISFPTQYASGTVLVNILTCASLSVGKSTTSVTFVAGAPQIYLPLGLARQICTNIVAPTPSSSIFSKIASIFTSSSKAASKTESKSSQTTYNSGTPAVATSNLGITQSSPSLSTASPLASSTAAAARPVFQTSAALPPSSTTGRSTSKTSQPASTTANAAAAGRPVVVTSAMAASPSSTTLSSSTTKAAAGRPVVATSAISPAQPKQRRALVNYPPPMSPSIQNSPNSPVPPTSHHNSRKPAPRQTTAPPASLSQHYRSENAASPSPSSPYGLSSPYSYSSSHLPMPGSRLNGQMRSNSETNLAQGHVRGHTAQSKSLHSLKKRGSSPSLSAFGPRSNSFAGPVPPIPPKLDSRAALFDDNAPYAHTHSLSSTSLALPTGSSAPRSRRNSNASIRSGFIVNARDPAYRKRNASQERLHMLSQEMGVPKPYFKPGFSPHDSVSNRAAELMTNPNHGRSTSSLHGHHLHHPGTPGGRSVSASPQPRSPNVLPNQHRPHDTRAQLAQELRQFQ